jgi:hypothetical protein
MSAPEITTYRQGEPKTFKTLLCHGNEVRGRWPSLRALADFTLSEASAHPGHHLLATLDDLGQACYTSGHAIDFHDLDNTEGHDLSGLDPAAFEDGAHVGYLSTASEFGIRRENLLRKAAGVSFDDLRGKLLWTPGSSILDVATHHADELDGEMYIQIVPVAHAWQTVAAFPNGYFTDDLSPMEVCALARRFEEMHDHRLFGIGASYLGFARNGAMDAPAAHALAEDILTLYLNADGAGLQTKLADFIAGADCFLLPYTC